METTENKNSKERLLQCANELFYAKGYDAVGVQEIVDRAGLTKPTLYYYFGSKKGLLEALVAGHFEELRTRYRTILSEEKEIRAALHQLADWLCDFFERDTQFYMLLMALFYSARENEAYQTVKPYIAELYDMVVQVFSRAAKELGNMNGRQRQFAIGFVGTINQYFILQYESEREGPCRISRRQLASLVDQFMYGIFS